MLFSREGRDAYAIYFRRRRARAARGSALMPVTLPPTLWETLFVAAGCGGSARATTHVATCAHMRVLRQCGAWCRPSCMKSCGLITEKHALVLMGFTWWSRAPAAIRKPRAPERAEATRATNEQENFYKGKNERRSVSRVCAEPERHQPSASLSAVGCNTNAYSKRDDVWSMQIKTSPPRTPLGIFL
jgi:hypothetical protein